MALFTDIQPDKNPHQAEPPAPPEQDLKTPVLKASLTDVELLDGDDEQEEPRHPALTGDPSDTELSLLRTACRTGDGELLELIRPIGRYKKAIELAKQMYRRRDEVPSELILTSSPQLKDISEQISPASACGPAFASRRDADAALEILNKRMLAEEILSSREKLYADGEKAHGSLEGVLEAVAKEVQRLEDIKDRYSNGAPSGELTDAEQIAAELQRIPGHAATPAYIRKKLGNMTSVKLSKVLKKDAESESPLLSCTGSTSNRRICLSMGNRRTLATLENLKPVDIDVKDMLPGKLADVLQPSKYPQASPPFMLCIAPGDGGKSLILFNVALHQAKLGKKTILIQFEGQNIEVVKQLAQFDSGRMFPSSAEARDYCLSQPWWQNIDIVRIEDPVSVEEECARIIKAGYQSVIIDYLTDSYFRTQDKQALSPYSAMTQHIGRELGDRGISFYSAVQAKKQGDSIPATWVEKANVCIEWHSVDTAPGGDVRMTWRIRKNKLGLTNAGEFFDLYMDPSSREITMTTLVEKAVVLQRDRDSKKTKAELDKQREKDDPEKAAKKKASKKRVSRTVKPSFDFDDDEDDL